jgi:hypothetical protein
MYPLAHRSLTAAQQYLMLQKSPICPGRGSLRKGHLVWEFDAQPTPLSRTYRLRITYQQNDIPQVLVVNPDLTILAEGRHLPHVYQQKPTRLCLYLPGAAEWLPMMQIADTIVPWAILWLFYFEDWLLSDDWKGGGVHPEVRDDKSKKKNSVHRRRRD